MDKKDKYTWLVLFSGIILILFFVLAYLCKWYLQFEGVSIMLFLAIIGIPSFVIFICMKERIIGFEDLSKDDAKFYFNQMLETFRTILMATSFIIGILWGFKRISATPGTAWSVLKFQTIMIVIFVLYVLIGTYVSIGTELKKKMKESTKPKNNE
ncbi:MAG: hypothetical protein ACTSWY_03095 [Promethearchaeota archaeon]